MVDIKTIEGWHDKYSHGEAAKIVKDLIWTHSLIVRDVGMAIAGSLKDKYGIRMDLELLEAGAMVHDIGVYKCFDDNFNKVEKYVRHGILGYEILKSEGVEEKIARFAKVHIGVGLTAENIIKQGLPLPPENMVPVTLEEEIITFADGFHSKSKPKFVEIEEQIEGMNKYSEDERAMLRRFIQKYGIPNLKELKDRYNNWHQKMQVAMSQLYAQQNQSK